MTRGKTGWPKRQNYSSIASIRWKFGKLIRSVVVHCFVEHQASIAVVQAQVLVNKDWVQGLRQNALFDIRCDAVSLRLFPLSTPKAVYADQSSPLSYNALYSTLKPVNLSDRYRRCGVSMCVSVAHKDGDEHEVEDDSSPPRLRVIKATESPPIPYLILALTLFGDKADQLANNEPSIQDVRYT